MSFIENLHPAIFTFLAGLFTWGMTSLGAATVFFFKKIDRRILNLLLGFAAGVMIAASFWSLLDPAISLSAELGHIVWLFPGVGFVAGGAFMLCASILMDRWNPSNKYGMKERKRSLKRSALLVTAVTIHNIPEGLSVGVAIGALSVPGSDVLAALLLVFGIGLQNFPEGAAVSLPLRREGNGRGKSFFYGQLSGFVEPCFAIIGYLLSVSIHAILPFALGFSAGAMISVVSSELLPEAAENKSFSTIGCTLGFVIMMVMDLALG